MQTLMRADELNQFSCNLMILKEICPSLIINSFNRERFFTVMQYSYISINCKLSSRIQVGTALGQFVVHIVNLGGWFHIFFNCSRNRQRRLTLVLLL